MSALSDVSISAARPRRRASTHRPAEGRFTRKSLANARLAVNGPIPARSLNEEIVPAAVQDPYEPKKKLLVSVNRRTDYLELEHSAGRLSVAAYLTGRKIQAVFERANGVSASSWGQDRIDVYTAKELQIIASLDRARLVTRYEQLIVQAVGTVGMRLLRSLLVEGETFQSIADARGMDSTRGKHSVAGRFRMLLEDLAVEWEAKGVRAH